MLASHHGAWDIPHTTRGEAQIPSDLAIIGLGAGLLILTGPLGVLAAPARRGHELVYGLSLLASLLIAADAAAWLLRPAAPVATAVLPSGGDSVRQFYNSRQIQCLHSKKPPRGARKRCASVSEGDAGEALYSPWYEPPTRS